MAIARRRFCLLTSFLYTSRSKYTHAHATVEIWPQQAKRIGLTPVLIIRASSPPSYDRTTLGEPASSAIGSYSELHVSRQTWGVCKAARAREEPTHSADPRPSPAKGAQLQTSS